MPWLEAVPAQLANAICLTHYPGGPRSGDDPALVTFARQA
jgi:hypothetical protein